MANAAKKIAGYTTRQLVAGFNVSEMSIWTWRTASAKRTALPTVKVGSRVYFPEAKVEAWAKKHGLAFDPGAALKAPTPGKAGPKAQVAAVPAKVPKVSLKQRGKDIAESVKARQKEAVTKPAPVVSKQVKATKAPKVAALLRKAPVKTAPAQASV